MLIAFLLLLNQIMGNITLVVTFSLWAYLTIRSWGLPAARALTVMLFGVFVTAASDVLVRQAHDLVIIEWLSRATWVGIVLVPTSMLHMALALANQLQVMRVSRWWTWVMYTCAAVLALIALVTDWMVSMPLRVTAFPTLTPQPLFVFASILAFGVVTMGWIVLYQVRRAILTPNLRRRMLYMLLSWYGPLLLSFPVLSLLPDAFLLPDALSLVLAALVIPFAAVFTMVTAYSATFVGAPQPDRIVKHDFMRWWLYGPFVGVSIVLFMQIVPVFAHWSRLPQDIWSVFGVMAMTVVMPIIINRVRPYIDALIYANEQDEMNYLRALPRNTFTQTDLRRFLENTLTIMCGALKSDVGLVAAPDEFGVYGVKSMIGERRHLRMLLDKTPLDVIIGQVAQSDQAINLHGFMWWILRDPELQVVGVLGVHTSASDFSESTHQLLTTLVQQVEHALVIVQMQQRLLDTLRTMEPEFATLQIVSSRIEQATPEALASLEHDVALMPDFAQLVRDALTHYWGGPKLSDSPLLSLQLVRRVVDEHGGNPTKALQQVLRQAIDNMRPDPKIPPNTHEWLLYNILEMRFLQGRKIRDTALRLSMSESDLYRKQRVALDEVARHLAHMEEQVRVPEVSTPPTSDTQ